MPEDMAMRFVSYRWLHSLAVQLLCTYVTALIVTMCFIVGVIWLRSGEVANMPTQTQLEQVADLIELPFEPRYRSLRLVDRSERVHHLLLILGRTLLVLIDGLERGANIRIH